MGWDGMGWDGEGCSTVSLLAEYYFNSYFELAALRRHAGLELWLATMDLAA